MAAGGKKSCVIYDSWGDLLLNLPKEMAGDLIQMIIRYAFNSEEVSTDDPAISAMFAMIKNKLDEDSAKYQEKVNRIEAARKQISNSNQSDISQKSDSNQTENSSVSVSDSVSVSPKGDSNTKRARAFVPPTLDDVREYCKERGNHVDPERWYDFYTAKGWVIGKNKMKDWKAAVRTWEKENSQAPPGRKANLFNNFSQNEYDYDELEKKLVAN